MTPKEAKHTLEEHGFEFENPDVDLWSSIFLEGERVGTLYDDEVYIAQRMPSLFNSNYHVTAKHSIKYSDHQADVKLQSAIDQIKYSLKEYEKEQRKFRAERVREYFQNRKKAEPIAKKLDELQEMVEWM